MGLTKETAEAVKDSLNGEDFSLDFTAVGKWRAHYKAQELGTLRVAVIRGPFRREVLTRARDKQEYQVDVVILKHLNSDPATGGIKTSEADALADWIEDELMPHFHRKELTTATGKRLFCMAQESVSPDGSLIAPEHLDDWRCFTGVLRLTFLLLSA